MAKRIILLQTGKTTEKYISDGIKEYSERIRRYIGFDIITIPELKNTKNMPVTEQKRKEGRFIMQSLNNDDFVVALDDKGLEFSTTEFAGQLRKMFMLSKKRIVFVIGGAWGFSDDVYIRADLRMSLSKLTFSHQMVRLLFAEQLYRILSIINGDPYHHE